MKKSYLLALILAFFALAMAGGSAEAVTYTTGFQIQNLSASDANISVSYYKKDGTLDIAAVTDTIPANGSKTYYPIAASSGFNGSVVISSDQPVAGIVNTLGDGQQYAASTESFSSGATSVMLPLIMRGNSGYNTWFNVQNTGSADATVTVAFKAGSAGTDYTAAAVTIKPGAAATFDQTGETNLGAKFIGSATITSDQPVVASVQQVGDTFKNMLGYNGFTGGSQDVRLPLIMANNSGYYTGFQIQNVGAAAATVNIAYGSNIAGSFAPSAESATLQPNESMTFLQNTGSWSGQYVGSATVTADQNVVAIVNQVKQTGVALGTAYDGFNPASATSKASAPLIMANNSNYYTGIQVMNVGTAAANITVTYGPNLAGSYAPAAETATIAPGDSYNSIQNGGGWAGQTYVGSLVVEGAAADKLVMIVNQINPLAPGDQFMTYNAFNF